MHVARAALTLKISLSASSLPLTLILIRFSLHFNVLNDNLYFSAWARHFIWENKCVSPLLRRPQFISAPPNPSLHSISITENREKKKLMGEKCSGRFHLFISRRTVTDGCCCRKRAVTGCVSGWFACTRHTLRTVILYTRQNLVYLSFLSFVSPYCCCSRVEKPKACPYVRAPHTSTDRGRGRHTFPF